MILIQQLVDQTGFHPQSAHVQTQIQELMPMEIIVRATIQALVPIVCVMRVMTQVALHMLIAVPVAEDQNQRFAP
jgi:hypothetical protein